jgi:hypothetical protein
LFQFERLAQQDLGFAAPAFRLITEALGGDAVEAVAVGAWDEEWVGHESDPVEKPMKPIWRFLLIFSIDRSRAANLR